MVADTVRLSVDPVALVDEALSTMTSRELVSASEVTDLLLDVRSAITGELIAHRI
jgi:hypothetical protein